MRPAISDSLISGQPLNLAYSYSNLGLPGAIARLDALFATHATGSVRLQVTGRPPMTRAPDFLPEQPIRPEGTAVAARPRRISLRDKECPSGDECMREGSRAPRTKSAAGAS